jgi:hypothetical protein
MRFMSFYFIYNFKSYNVLDKTHLNILLNNYKSLIIRCIKYLKLLDFLYVNLLYNI